MFASIAAATLAAASPAPAVFAQAPAQATPSTASSAHTPASADQDVIVAGTPERDQKSSSPARWSATRRFAISSAR